MFGLLNVNKCQYKTSRDAVNAVQRLTKPAKVGHAGTLDPMATGVLVIAIGPATRLISHLQAMPKTYLAGFRLGFESDTEDISGQIKPVAGAGQVSSADLTEVLPTFVGQIQQLPPKFSALKVNGKRAYSLARKGKPVELKPRTVEIYTLRLVEFQYPDFTLEIECGSGTYIRSLGRDIGRKLDSGAIMTSLVRTKVGSCRIEDALPSEDISEEAIKEHLVPPQNVLGGIPIVQISDEQSRRFLHGHSWQPGSPIAQPEVAAVDSAGRLMGILKRRNDECFTPKINFSGYWLDEG